MRTKISIAVAVAIVVALGAGAWWRKHERQAVGEAAEDAAKQQGYEVEIYRPGWLGMETLVYDIVDTDSDARRVDAIHGLVAAAEQLDDEVFDRMVLAYHGERRLEVDGAYVRRTGRERPYQNSAYTVRKFPEHVRRLDGDTPWPAPRGGALYVLKAEMENVNEVLGIRPTSRVTDARRGMC